MYSKKIIFLDRDGTLIIEPKDKQVDTLEKFSLVPNVLPALLQLKDAGFTFIIVSNQDGLGTSNYPHEKYIFVQNFLTQLFNSQGIQFEAVRICPHFFKENCDCRKPRIGLVLDYLVDQKIDKNYSYMIGDRESDLEFARNIGVKGIRIGIEPTKNWKNITEIILLSSRKSEVYRKTNETQIQVTVNLDVSDGSKINTGIGFFNHLLEQLAKHGGFQVKIHASGDLSVDDHHTVEDTALALGEAIFNALGDKRGIRRYGFLLPMDESLAQISLDLSGRPYLDFSGKFERESIGNFSTELVSHFFRSFSQSLGATLHIQVSGENTHHMIEAIFKGVGRTLRDAIKQIENTIPSTKGTL